MSFPEEKPLFGGSLLEGNLWGSALSGTEVKAEKEAQIELNRFKHSSICCMQQNKSFLLLFLHFFFLFSLICPIQEMLEQQFKNFKS